MKFNIPDYMTFEEWCAATPEFAAAYGAKRWGLNKEREIKLVKILEWEREQDLASGRTPAKVQKSGQKL